jgi:hypothetical protein
MIVTENEARTKWCPHARDADLGGNRDSSGEQPQVATCIGSQCMAWRWLQTTKHSGRGYCGLSGSV